MSDAKHSSPFEIEITEPSSLNEQAAVALVIVGALVAVADRQVSQVERDEVDESPAPALGRVVSLDDWMTAQPEMSRRVPKRRIVAAPHMSAGATQPQVYPFHAEL